jgi:hypothetical protein
MKTERYSSAKMNIDITQRERHFCAQCEMTKAKPRQRLRVSENRVLNTVLYTVLNTVLNRALNTVLNTGDRHKCHSAALN